MSKSGIYQIRNLTTSRIYVGSAVSLPHRWNGHKYHLKNKSHKNIRLQNAFNKYGMEDFVFSVIEYVENKTDLISREQFWMDKLNAASRDNYNLSPTARSCLGCKHTPESRAKLSAAKMGHKQNTPEVRTKLRTASTGNKYALGFKHTPEARARMSCSGKSRATHPNSLAALLASNRSGKQRTPEHCANISAAKKGTKQSLEQRTKMSARMMGNQYTKGHTLSEEHRAKLRGIKLTPEQHAKMSKARIGNTNSLGYKHTAETRAKVSAAGKLRWARVRENSLTQPANSLEA